MDDDVRQLQLEAVARGEVSLAEIEGLTAAEGYQIADFGWMLLEQGRFEAAIAVFETLTLSNPHHAYFHALLGSALQRSGAGEAALEAYARAIEIDGTETAALVHRAELLLGRGGSGDGDEALSLLERALAFDPFLKRPESRRARALACALSDGPPPAP